MKLLLLFAIAIGAMGACPVCPVCPGTPPATTKPVRDLWVWQSEVASDPVQQAAFFKFAALHAVRNIHIECEGLIQPSMQPKLAAFLPLAQAKGIGVYCLFANSTWALTANHGSAVALAQLVATFKASNPLLLGADFDIEPDWTSTTQKSIEAQYVAMIQKIKAALGTTPLMMTIPFWWSGTSYDIAINGVTKHLDQWVLDYADIAIMDFRNTTARITPGMDTINHAATAHRKALVGLLMEQDLDYTYTSFYSFFSPTPAAGETYMEKQITDSAAVFMGNTAQAPAFDGFIIEDYKWYLQAAPL